MAEKYTSFNPFDWYWIDDARSQAYSSAKGAYVPLNDPDFVAWQDAENVATEHPANRTGDLATGEAILNDVLRRYDLKIGGARTADDVIDDIIAGVAAPQDNSRALVGVVKALAQLTGTSLADARTAIKNNIIM